MITVHTNRLLPVLLLKSQNTSPAVQQGHEFKQYSNAEKSNDSNK